MMDLLEIWQRRWKFHVVIVVIDRFQRHWWRHRHLRSLLIGHRRPRDHRWRRWSLQRRSNKIRRFHRGDLLVVWWVHWAHWWRHWRFGSRLLIGCCVSFHRWRQWSLLLGCFIQGLKLIQLMFILIELIVDRVSGVPEVELEETVEDTEVVEEETLTVTSVTSVNSGANSSVVTARPSTVSVTSVTSVTSSSSSVASVKASKRLTSVTASSSVNF